MALRAVDQPEFSGRLAYLLRRSGVKANALSLSIGEKPGYISWLMTQARTVPIEVVIPIATALAGKGDLMDDPEEIAKYLIGIPHLRLVRGSNEATTDIDQTRRFDRFGQTPRFDPRVKAA